MTSDSGKPKTETPASGPSFLQRHQGNFFLVGLMIYVVLLLAGTIGNLFEIEAITSFWLYR